MTTSLGQGFEKHAIGQSVPRTEDPRLLRGEGRYTDDVNLPGQAHAYVFRSPYAHGRIDAPGRERRRGQAAGVLDVLVADDLDAGRHQDHALRRGR